MNSPYTQSVDKLCELVTEYCRDLEQMTQQRDEERARTQALTVEQLQLLRRIDGLVQARSNDSQEAELWIDELVAKCAILDSRVDVLSKCHDEVCAERDNWKQACTSGVSRCTELRAQLATKEEEITQLVKQRDAAIATCDLWGNKSAELQAKYDELQVKYAELMAECEKWKSHYLLAKDVQDATKTISADRDYWHTQHDKVADSLSMTLRKIITLENSYVDVHTSHARAVDDNHELREKLGERTAMLGRAREENDQLRDENAVLLVERDNLLRDAKTESRVRDANGNPINLGDYVYAKGHDNGFTVGVIWCCGSHVRVGSDCDDMGYATTVVTRGAKPKTGAAGWFAEFYPVDANSSEAQKAPAAHALRKWRGIRKENLDKHGLVIDGTRVEDAVTGNFVHRLGGPTCALCASVLTTFGSCPADCFKCPLAHVLGHACTCPGMPWRVFMETGDPEPMIAALEATVAKEGK